MRASRTSNISRRRAPFKRRKVSITTLLLVFTGFLCVLYTFVFLKLHKSSHQQNSSMRYAEWRTIATNLAKLPPDKVLSELQMRDPFGTRTFETTLLQKETDKGAVLTMEEMLEIFPCPADRITLPDQRDHSKARAFQSHQEGLSILSTSSQGWRDTLLYIGTRKFTKICRCRLLLHERLGMVSTSGQENGGLSSSLEQYRDCHSHETSRSSHYGK